MKKFFMIPATLGIAVTISACSDDSSSPTAINGGNNGGGKSGKACLNTFNDGEIRCFTHESVEFLCGGSSSELKSSVLVEACPEGYTIECPNDAGEGSTYFYREGMTDCHKF